MTGQIKSRYRFRMLLRRRICRRGLCLLPIAFLTFYICVLLLGEFHVPTLTKLTELHRCPACYGVSICPELYSNQIRIDSNSIHNLFNAKNIVYGTTRTGRRVVLKKLAHDWELAAMDKRLCSFINRPEGCNVTELLNITNLEELMAKIVSVDVQSEHAKEYASRSCLVLCPLTVSLPLLLRPVIGAPRTGPKTPEQRIAALNALVMLLVNAEPIILQLLDSRSWPVPELAGACGRLVVVSHAGDALATRLRGPWLTRLQYAAQILRAAMDFTFKHDQFRFYLLDWSLDNIAVDERGRVVFVDLEHVIVLDKHSTPQPELGNWLMRYTREDYGAGYAFSIDKICHHHLSDHNLWSACYVLAGDDRPLLLPVPADVRIRSPHVETLLTECLRGADRFKAVSALLNIMEGLLTEVR